ncbi:CHAP domain-containing protein [Kitasatospora sp. NPDC049258]|uniref:CHAP domain-containing protein n=1 Tax=Kitasatospora sp. NPDC049258 TaxID=3155394 RepID=UPI0034220B82
MKPQTLLRRISTAAAMFLAFGLPTVTGLSTAAAATGADAANLAAANVGKSAGTCANTPTSNSLGGDQFGTSCAGGYSGGPEYWCADFVKWAWQNSGFAVQGLDASAASFQSYGLSHGTQHSSAGYQPQPGDAVEYGSTQDSDIHHVAIVTAVTTDGSVVTANGDWNGAPQAGSMAEFAKSSRVVQITIPAAQTAVGSVPDGVDPAHGYYIAGYTTPSTVSANPYTPAAVCGAGFGVVDSQGLDGARVYLLYNATSGQNCVTTLVDHPAGAVPLNATLSVQGGASASDPGTFASYAGPVRLAAPGACVQWGGTFKTTSWTSDWGHCG